ncbi:MAG: hypothetical protein M3441_01050 [Chloroflexota bacterium]|nr:hypothetical protein [Chloroflexota bacterium]
MQEPPIKGIDSLKKLTENARNMEQFRRAFPLMRPFLKLLGADVENMDVALRDANIDELVRQTNDVVTVPDRFNALFASRGWIIYEMLNFDVARAAVAMAEAGDIDGAELYLADHYDEESLKYHFIWMRAVKAFMPRLPLAEKARTDYLDGRYHACVPVVLAILDGIVNDLGPRGFFAQGVNLQAWDSISAHSSGLEQLSKVLGANRTTTTTEQISIPFRHGIQHGMDLGYDNKLVAAKAWAALFAIRDWALKVERGQTEQPPPEPKKTFTEILRERRAVQEFKARVEAWKPRHIEVGKDVPAAGEPDAYPENTPERKLAEFFYYWGKRNFGYMARCFSRMVLEDPNSGKAAGEIREQYADKHVKAFEIREIVDAAAAISTINVSVAYEEYGRRIDGEFEIRLMYEDDKGDPLVRNMPGGIWRIVRGHP